MHAVYPGNDWQCARRKDILWLRSMGRVGIFCDGRKVHSLFLSTQQNKIVNTKIKHSRDAHVPAVKLYMDRLGSLALSLTISIANSSALVQGCRRSAVIERTLFTVAASTGDPVCPHSRLTYVNTEATSSSVRAVPSGGIRPSVPSLPWKRMRAVIRARASARGDPTRLGASSGLTATVGHVTRPTHVRVHGSSSLEPAGFLRGQGRHRHSGFSGQFDTLEHGRRPTMPAPLRSGRGKRDQHGLLPESERTCRSGSSVRIPWSSAGKRGSTPGDRYGPRPRAPAPAPPPSATGSAALPPALASPRPAVWLATGAPGIGPESSATSRPRSSAERCHIGRWSSTMW